MVTRRHLLGAAAALVASPRSAIQAQAAQPRPTPGPALRLKALLGDYPHTFALKHGLVGSPRLQFEFADANPVFSAFKRVVRDLEFDVAELSLVTYLQAKAYGKPLVLLPAVMFSRFQHPYLVYNSQRGNLSAPDLPGRRVGVRLYTSTTGTWLRGILASDYHVDGSAMNWVVFDQPHLAEFHDPKWVSMARPEDSLPDMLFSGAIDAAIIDPVPADSRLKTVIADPAAAAQQWHARNRALQINHMVVVSEQLTKQHPDAVREIYGLLLESKKAARAPAGDSDSTPFGLKANRRNLEVAIDYVYRQGLIPRRFRVEELFNEVTGALG